jgi:hypothetical protein
LYLRWYKGSAARYEKVDGATYHDAELAQLRLERKLRAASQGFVVPEETDIAKFHRIPDVIAAYLADLRLNRRPEKSINSKKSELEEFSCQLKPCFVNILITKVAYWLIPIVELCVDRLSTTDAAFSPPLTVFWNVAHVVKKYRHFDHLVAP